MSPYIRAPRRSGRISSSTGSPSRRPGPHASGFGLLSAYWVALRIRRWIGPNGLARYWRGHKMQWWPEVRALL